MELTEYFVWDVDGVLSPLGAWPCFDDVPKTPHSVWVFEGIDELASFVEDANILLAQWKGED